ncbi:MAG: hemolysin family protein [Actinomycetota bacterium]|nr:hemolysin family protein [Actinomycetota bacterium]
MLVALGLVAVLALILANGWFVAGEFAFVAARRGRLEELAEQGDRRAERALAVLSRLSFVLSGAQLGITVTSLVVGFIAEPTFGRALTPLLRLAGLPDSAAFGVAVSVGFVLATATQMVLGELGPKNLAIAEPERVALSLARGTLLYNRLAGPVINVFDRAANRLVRSAGIEPVDELKAGVSAEELQLIISESSREGSLDEGTAALLRRALEFRQLRAADAMVPRPQVAALPVDATCADLRGLAIETGHSRFPVIGDDGLDDVAGVVQAKDVFAVPPEARDHTPVRSLLKPVLAVPESTLLGPLLGELRDARSQLAVVVDEYGGTAGIVTLEDIVEELVGNIQDEYDPAEPGVQRLAAGAFRLPGSWRVDETVRDTGVALPEGDYDTVGGLVMAVLGRVPAAGDSVTVPGATLHVETMSGLAVDRVRLVTPPAQPADAPADAGTP